MANRSFSKVYRLQGIPPHIRSDGEVVDLVYAGRDQLLGYDVSIYSLATALGSKTTKVATLMFSPRPCQASKRRRTTVSQGQQQSALSGNDLFIDAFSQTKDDLILDDNFLGWTPLNEIYQDDCEIDCVAISGIGSHPFGSWQPHGSNKEFMWLRDALPKLLPQARVVLYGYDTQLTNSSSFKRVEDIALSLVKDLRLVRNSAISQRDLVFLAHSLGGIVLKQALITLANSPGMIEWGHLESLAGALFFGVPNHGMVVSHLRAIADGMPNQRLVEQLRERSPYLARLEVDFSRTYEAGSLSKKLFFWGYETKESILPTVSPMVMGMILYDFVLTAMAVVYSVMQRQGHGPIVDQVRHKSNL
ncbi:hypothetical protein F5Y15DRAFT_414378 [Xylariaceae sp. FL0016]|nr:hypothetical protein F5Y15DRAFT_414378 [Xylariaceae sp. FL0016]